MLDLDLLRSFVSVVDAGGFTRAGERVHRTQSTVSQQIRRLEASLGRPLLLRNGKRVAPTEAGERLLSYARRLLALSAEARDVIARSHADGVTRLGISDDFAAYRLAQLLSKFARTHPGLRLDVVVRPTVRDQEMADSLVVSGFRSSYWEGSCTVSGTRAGHRVAGKAYTELTGYGTPPPSGQLQP